MGCKTTVTGGGANFSGSAGGPMLPIVSMPPSRISGVNGTGLPTTFWNEGSVQTCSLYGQTGTGGDGSVCDGSFGGLPMPGGSGNYPATKAVCCLGADVLVPLAQGGSKRAEDVEIGDALRGPNGEPQLVEKLIRGTEPRFFVQTTVGSFICSRAHRVQLTNGEFIAVQDIDLCADELRGADGSTVEVIERTPLEEGPVFCWICEPEHIFECAGIMHHNSKINYVISW